MSRLTFVLVVLIAFVGGVVLSSRLPSAEAQRAPGASAQECRDTVARQRRALRRAARAAAGAKAKAKEELAAIEAETEAAIALTRATRAKVERIEHQIMDLIDDLPGATP